MGAVKSPVRGQQSRMLDVYERAGCNSAVEWMEALSMPVEEATERGRERPTVTMLIPRAASGAVTCPTKAEVWRSWW